MLRAASVAPQSRLATSLASGSFQQHGFMMRARRALPSSVWCGDEGISVRATEASGPQDHVTQLSQPQHRPVARLTTAHPHHLMEALRRCVTGTRLPWVLSPARRPIRAGLQAHVDQAVLTCGCGEGHLRVGGQIEVPARRILPQASRVSRAGPRVVSLTKGDRALEDHPVRRVAVQSDSLDPLFGKVIGKAVWWRGARFIDR